MDKASLTLGYLVGRQIAGQRRAVEKTPVAYLYGKDKVRLPPLPEWDDKTFQYVYLSYTEDGAGVYAIYACTAPKHLTGTASDGKPWIEFDNGEAVLFSGGLWIGGYDPRRKFKDFTEYTYPPEGTAFTSGLPIWTNYSIYNADGSLYLEKSDPIPVYE